MSRIKLARTRVLRSTKDLRARRFDHIAGFVTRRYTERAGLIQFRSGSCPIPKLYQNAHWPRTKRLLKRARKSNDQTVITAYHNRFFATNAKSMKIGNIVSE